MRSALNLGERLIHYASKQAEAEAESYGWLVPEQHYIVPLGCACLAQAMQPAPAGWQLTLRDQSTDSSRGWPSSLPVPQQGRPRLHLPPHAVPAACLPSIGPKTGACCGRCSSPMHSCQSCRPICAASGPTSSGSTRAARAGLTRTATGPTTMPSRCTRIVHVCEVSWKVLIAVRVLLGRTVPRVLVP